MFLWRLGSNSLPTKENLFRRIDHVDPVCVLCKNEPELQCPVAWVIWHSCWGFRSDAFLVTSPIDIIKLILEPPRSSCPPTDIWLVTLHMAVILDEIWRLRNHVLYNGDQVDVLQIILHILSKVSEISTISAPAAPPPPLLNWVKINTDAALSTSNAAIAAVARDFKGEVIKVWTKLLHLCSPHSGWSICHSLGSRACCQRALGLCYLWRGC